MPTEQEGVGGLDGFRFCAIGVQRVEGLEGV